jgi:hypothetical protein
VLLAGQRDDEFELVDHLVGLDSELRAAGAPIIQVSDTVGVGQSAAHDRHGRSVNPEIKWLGNERVDRRHGARVALRPPCRLRVSDLDGH